MIYTELLKDFCRSLYDHKENVITIIDKFIHKDYEQCINGVRLDRIEYINHVIEQRKNITVAVFDYKHILEKKNELFANYYFNGKNVGGSPIKAEVIAYFCFKDNKIFRIHGMVRLVEGGLSDVDMHNHAL